SDLLRRRRNRLELARGEPAVVADRRVADELADLLGVLGRDLLGDLDEEPADEHTRVLKGRQRLLLGPVREAAGPEVVVLVEVAHPLASNLLARDLHAAALADDALVADALVLAAVALPVLCRTEDALAEEPVALRLQRPVVDRLGLGDFARGPVADLLARRQPNANRVKVVDIDQLAPLFFLVPRPGSLLASSPKMRSISGDSYSSTSTSARSASA